MILRTQILVEGDDGFKVLSRILFLLHVLIGREDVIEVEIAKVATIFRIGRHSGRQDDCTWVRIEFTEHDGLYSTTEGARLLLSKVLEYIQKLWEEHERGQWTGLCECKWERPLK